MAPSIPDFAGLTGRLRGASVPAMAELDDAALVAAVEAMTALRHELERWQAIAVAEVSKRSRVGFGQRGLAQRAGHSSASSFLQSVTRASRRETVTLVGVGEMIAATDAAADLSQARHDDPVLAAVIPEPDAPWFAELADAVASGALTVPVAHAIRSGLGEPGGDADATRLASELSALITTCRRANADADAARRAARQARDRLDAAGVSARAERQQLAQFWRVWVKPDGMVHGEFELEPENGMLVKAVFDQLAHPRRTDAAVRRRFGDPLVGDALFARARAERERDAAEGLAQLLRAGASVDPGRVLDQQKPSVRLVVNARALATGAGTGLIEGHPDRIPLASIHAGLCEGHLPMRFDDAGAVLDLGRDERLFTPKQKAVLAVRDGGCMDPDCTRPPSWTEAHHIDHWARDGGRTDIADGILLCRRDHLRYHNQGWQVRRKGSAYLAHPAGVRRPRSDASAHALEDTERHHQPGRPAAAPATGSCRSGWSTRPRPRTRGRANGGWHASPARLGGVGAQCRGSPSAASSALTPTTLTLTRRRVAPRARPAARRGARAAAASCRGRARSPRCRRASRSRP